MKIRVVLIIITMLIYTIKIFAQNWSYLDYSPDQQGLENNPLKGFASLWNPSNNFPHSIQGHLFGLDDIMTGMNTFDWTIIDQAIANDASNGNFSYIQVNIDPAIAGKTDMPSFLIDQVDWKENPDDLCPDWNNEILMQAMFNFISAFGEKYNNDSRVFLVHFGLYGMWGEWHVGEYGGNFAMTAYNQQRLSNAYIKAFPDKQLLARYPGTLPDNEVVGYSDGLFFGQSIQPDTPWFFYNQLKSAHADKNWKLHAIGGEIDPGLQNEIWKSWPNTVGQDVTMCLDSIHPTWLFSHYVLTMSSQPGSNEWNNAIRCQKMLGYTFYISKYKLTANDGKITVELGVQNKGIAPIYANWKIELGVLNSNRQFQSVGKEKCNINYILPGNTNNYRAISASKSISDGTYKVLLRVINPMEKYSSKAKPFRFANTTQDADSTGWLTLGEITISDGNSGIASVRVSGISISTDSVTMTVGDKLEISSSVTPIDANNKNVIWISDHPSTASADSTGFVIAGPLTGKAIITAFTEDGCFEAKSIINVEPQWIEIPGKVEAEYFVKQSGVQTENCSDVNGGLNVGWIDNEDWLLYPVINNSESNYFSASFRVSSPNNGGLITLYADSNKIGEIHVPNTGSWQNWRSVLFNLKIEPGKHYIKIVATNGGFNINYIDFLITSTSGAEIYENRNLKIYPLPASKYITIETGNWKFNKLEFIDLAGKTVYSKEFGFQSNLELSITINSGIYILRLRGRDQVISKKIVIK